MKLRHPPAFVSPTAFAKWVKQLIARIPAFYLMYTGRRVARESRLGPCPACGYDLLRTPLRSPECGVTR